MEIGDIIPHIEALIFASDKPLTAMELTELANNAFGFMDEKLTLEQIQTAIDGIVEKYRSEFYPFEVRESGGGLQFLTKKEYHKTVAQLNGEKFLKRLSNAALETLSIIAYKQPVTKGEIESIRGVSSDYAIQRLLEKELVVITGRNEKMPGHPLVYATSRSFMDYFGINSAEDLPKLKEVFDEALVNPTQIDNMRQNPDGEDAEQDTADNTDNNELLAVTRAGELTTAKIKKDKEDTANGKRSSQNQVSEESLSDDSLSDSGRDNLVEEGLDAGADSGSEESITNDASEQGIKIGDNSAGDDSADDASTGDDFAENDIAEDNLVEDETLEEDLVDNDAEKDLFEEDQREEEDLSNNESEDMVAGDVAEEDLVEENLDEENEVEEDLIEEDLIEENIAGEEDVVEEDVVEEDVVEEDVVEEDVVEEDVAEEDVVEEDPDEDYLNEDGSADEDSIERDALKGADTSDESDESDDQESGGDETDDGSDNNADTNKGKPRNQD